ncbi:MAG TPA: hypothetical protein VGN52_17305 [Burkholderiales bacterium]
MATNNMPNVPVIASSQRHGWNWDGPSVALAPPGIVFFFHIAPHLVLEIRFLATVPPASKRRYFRNLRTKNLHCKFPAKTMHRDC